MQYFIGNLQIKIMRIEFIIIIFYNNKKVAEKVGQLEQARIYIEEIDGLTKIEKLQDNENEEVYKLAFHMVEKFFSDEVN